MQEQRDASVWRQAVRWIAEKGAGTVISITVGAVFAATAAYVGLGGYLGLGEDPPAPLREQVDSLRSRLAAGGFRVGAYERVDLRPNIPSLVMTISRRSRNEVRIYDYVRRRLQLAFRYAPVLEIPRVGKRPIGETTSFTIAKFADVDSDPDLEVLGAFEAGSGKGVTVRVPVAISWSDRFRRWQLDPLLRRPTRFAGWKPKSEAYFAEEYEKTQSWFGVRDRDSDRRIRGYALTSFTVGAGGAGSALYMLGGLRVGDERAKPGTTVLELRLWSFHRGPRGLVAGRCDDVGGITIPLYYRFPVAVNDVYTDDLDDVMKEVGPRIISTACSSDSGEPRA